MDGFSCRDTKLVLFRFLQTFFTLVLVLKWKLTKFEKNTAMYIFDTNNNKLYEVDEKLSSAQNKLLYMGYWIGAESRKIKVICSPKSIGRGYEIIEENDYKRLKKAREENAKYMDNNVRVIKREEEERNARIAAQDRSMQLKREAEKKEKEEAIHAAQRRELEVRKMEEEEKRRNEEKNNRLEREMLVEQERRKKEEDQSCKEREKTSQEDDDCIIMSDSFNCCSNSGESSSNQKCIIPLRCSKDIPDVQNYENYEAAKDCIIQYELPEWLCKQLILLREDYANMQNTNVHLSCEEGEQFWRVFYQVRYFPRTLCETFFVFNEEFSCSKPQLPDKMNILSIGCGSGGDVIGLLLAIDSYLTKKVEVSIVVFEVNENAYNCFENNLNSVTKLFQHVEVKKQNRRNSAISFDDNDFEGLEDNFHFILCSKMVNEIMRKKIKDAVNEWDGINIEDLKNNIEEIERTIFQGLYYEFLGKLSPLMSENGYCLLSELTDKPIPKELSSSESFDFYHANNHNSADYDALSRLNSREEFLLDLNNIVKFLPQYLNSGVKSFIRERPAFRPVSPWGCDGCWTRADCFTQLQFYIHNPVLRNDNDRFEGVCFKLIKKDRRVNRDNGILNQNLAVNIRRGESRFIVKSCGRAEELTGDNIQSAFERPRN